MRYRERLPVDPADRKTRKLYAARSLTMESGEIREAFLRALAGAAVRTITLDNGSEFAEFRRIGQDTGAEVYFAEPRPPGSGERMKTRTGC
ncbi:MAG: hypothetical protein Pg6C_03680 [Treponemataceae bacterium]|nr:MAG: hypothetical protein Pg6C_03680 [Treponemataceae bacterium]